MKNLTVVHAVLSFVVAIPSLVIYAPSRATDPVGTVHAVKIRCTQGKLPGHCYMATVSCPNLPDMAAWVKMISAAATPAVGTVIYGTGGLGSAIYETETFGPWIMSQLSTAGYTGVEFAWPSVGWQGNANGMGVRSAACRYATLANWIAQTFGTSKTPVCATGNSAGAFQIGSGLAHYGLDGLLRDVELTSGPPFGNVAEACINTSRAAVSPCSGHFNTLGVGYDAAVKYVDPAYPDNRCSSAYVTHSTQHEQEFINDSVMSPDAVLSYPNTFVDFILGGQDTTSAVRQAMLYRSVITSGTGVVCVPDAPHVVEHVADGGAAVVNGILNNCK